MVGSKLQSTPLRVFQKLKRFEVNNPDATGNGGKTVVSCCASNLTVNFYTILVERAGEPVSLFNLDAPQLTMRYAKLRCYAYKFLGFGDWGGGEDLASR